MVIWEFSNAPLDPEEGFMESLTSMPLRKLADEMETSLDILIGKTNISFGVSS